MSRKRSSGATTSVRLSLPHCDWQLRAISGRPRSAPKCRSGEWEVDPTEVPEVPAVVDGPVGRDSRVGWADCFARRGCPRLPLRGTDRPRPRGGWWGGVHSGFRAPPWDGLVSPPFGGPAFADVRGQPRRCRGCRMIGGSVVDGPVGRDSRVGGGLLRSKGLPSAFVPGDRPAASTWRVGWCA